MPIFVNAAYVLVVLLAIEERMRLIQNVPKLVLKPVRAPVVSREYVPTVAVHQIAIDLRLVLELCEELIKYLVDVTGGIDLGDVQLVRAKSAFDFLEQAGR